MMKTDQPEDAESVTMNLLSLLGIPGRLWDRIAREPISVLVMVGLICFGCYSVIWFGPSIFDRIQAGYDRYHDLQIKADERRDAAHERMLKSIQDGFEKQAVQQRDETRRTLNEIRVDNTKRDELLRDSIKDLKQSFDSLRKAALEVHNLDQAAVVVPLED